MQKRGYRHNYVLYYTGADYYDLPYWTFVHLAKDAGATVELHRLAVADTLAIDRYLDENCLVLPEETGRKESVRDIICDCISNLFPELPARFLTQ